MAGKLLKYLPKPTSFSIPSGVSGGAAKAAFSGPIVSIIPKEARRKKKGDEEDQEPTSPKVSCIGQVKHKNHGTKSSKKSKKLNAKAKAQSFNGRVDQVEEKNKKPSAIQGMFRRKMNPRRPPEPEMKAEVVVAAPEVGRIRRYSSGRAVLADFDWKAVAAAEGEEEVMVAHSAPMAMAGEIAAAAMEKRKEVNLWRRRTARPPERLVVV